MPALRRRLEGIAKLPVRPAIHAIVTVGDAAYQDYLAHLSGFNITWVIGHNEQAVATILPRWTCRKRITLSGSPGRGRW